MYLSPLLLRPQFVPPSSGSSPWSVACQLRSVKSEERVRTGKFRPSSSLAPPRSPLYVKIFSTFSYLRYLHYCCLFWLSFCVTPIVAVGFSLLSSFSSFSIRSSPLVSFTFLFLFVPSSPLPFSPSSLKTTPADNRRKKEEDGMHSHLSLSLSVPRPPSPLSLTPPP